ncbi:hypothetical protein Tco_0774960 [Tanacetum coccineum]|uniref:Uncharacterized protein n=1 Tax=Tanacetum coccineum TaxID=301880 RepID=A0ABQ4ZPY0_9ASTR
MKLCHSPRFTKVIINHFLSQHKSFFKLQFQHYHTIKDDSIVSRLKFVRIRKDYHEYGLPIPDMMLNDKIKQSESYQMFIKYSTGQISPKKSRGKDLPSAPKTKPATSKLKLKGVQSLTPKEQEAADIMQALKESKKTSRRQPCTRGLRIPDESTVVPAISSEGTGTKLGVPNEEKVTSEENVILEWGSEQESEYSEEDQGDDEEVDWIDSDEDEEKKDDTDDDKSIDLEMTDDEFIHGNAKISDVAKADAKKIEEIKDDAKKAELPPTSSSLISKPVVTTPILETPLVAPSTNLLPPSSVFNIPPVPHQTTTPIITPPITTDASTITIVVPESDALSAVQLRVAKLEKDMSELKKIDHSTEALATLKC